MHVTVRPVQRDDFFSWLDIYHEHARKNAHPVTDETTLQAWLWITSSEHPLEAFLAYDEYNTPVALAHTREFLVPFGATKGIDLDAVIVKDTNDHVTISHAFDTFIEGLAKQRNYSVVRTDQHYRQSTKTDELGAETEMTSQPIQTRVPEHDTTWSTLPVYTVKPTRS